MRDSEVEGAGTKLRDPRDIGPGIGKIVRFSPLRDWSSKEYHVPDDAVKDVC